MICQFCMVESANDPDALMLAYCVGHIVGAAQQQPKGRHLFRLCDAHQVRFNTMRAVWLDAVAKEFGRGKS